MLPETPSIETSYSWIRLTVSITLSTLGCVGLWSLVVALPSVQADFGVGRAGASLPYTLTTIGFMIGGIAVGRLADRFGILPPFAGATILLGLGYIVTASSHSSPVSPSASAARRASRPWWPTPRCGSTGIAA
jgi:MFS family permease